MAFVSDITNTSYSPDRNVNALLDEGPDWNYLTRSGNVIYYSFEGRNHNDGSLGSAVSFNAAQQTATRQILSYVSTVTGIRFQEVSGSQTADLRFAAGNILDPQIAGLCIWGYSYQNSMDGQLISYEAKADVYLDTYGQDPSMVNPTPGTEGYQILLHEIGHALGLKHPFEAPITLSATLDNSNNTVMSYTWSGDNKTTFQSLDLSALQWIYGGDGLKGSYGLNSTNGPSLTARATDLTPPTIMLQASTLSLGVAQTALITFTLSEDVQDFTLSDITVTGGTLSDFSGSGKSYSVLLTPKANSNTDAVVRVGSGTFSDAAGNWNADGADSNNALSFRVNTVRNSETGSSGSDSFLGGNGKQIDGGAGIDIVVYDSLLPQITRNIDDSFTVGTDLLRNIERLHGLDRYVALDIGSATSAGGIFRLYQATFARQPDLDGLGYWIAQADKGQSAVEMAERFTWSQEFQQLYRVSTNDQYLTGSNLDSLISSMYRNVLGREADAGGLAYYVSVIQNQTKTVGRVLAEISDSNENYIATIGQIQNGIEYHVWQG